MPAGLIIYNDYDTILIDDSYRNMAITGQGSVTLGGDGTNVINVTLANNEMLALRSTGGVCCAYQINMTQMEVRGTAGNVIQWYRFGPGSTASSTHGLQVYTATGQLAFDSGMQQARVRDSFTHTPGSVTFPLTKTYEAGRTYAAVMARQAVYEEIESWEMTPGWYGWDSYINFMGVRMSGSSVIFNYVPRFKFVGSNGEPFAQVPIAQMSTTLSAHIIDVTGY